MRQILQVQQKKLNVMINNWSTQMLSGRGILTPLKLLAKTTALLLIILWVFPKEHANAQDVAEADSVDMSMIGADSFSGASYFSSELTFPEFADFGDISLQEALIRVPGVQSSRDGEINIRGTGYNNFGISFNGLRLANSGLGTRYINTENISTDVLRSIEITKVLDPSMRADALAGVINLNTNQMLPQGERRTVSALAGGEANTKYMSRTGPGSRGWINYAERFSDTLAVSVSMGYHQAINSWEELELGFGAQDFGNGFVDVYERAAPAVRISEQGRLSATANVSLTPNEDNSYYLTGYFNNNDRTFTSHQDSWITGGDFIDPSTTGANGEEGSFRHDASRHLLTSSQLAIQAGGEHEMESYSLSYDAGWSQGRSDSRDYLFPFQFEDVNYAIDLSTQNRPQFTFTNRLVQILEEEGTVRRIFMLGQDFERTVQEHVNNEVSARVDVKLPIERGTLKAGLHSVWSINEGEYDENSFEYNRTLRMNNFNVLREPNRNIDVINDNYVIPWFVNTANARAFFESQRPLFTGDDLYQAYQSQIRNYSANEQIYAAYGMGEFKFGDLSVKAGVRGEYLIKTLEGNNVTFDEDGELLPILNTEETESRLDIFPNLQLQYGVADQSNLKLAYSRTIDRPDYFPQTPFQRIDNQDSTTFAGNALLEPIISDNIDLKFEQETGNTGTASIAGFYKSLTNFIEQRQFSENPGSQYNGYDRTGFFNSDETATIYGVEVALEQRLVFLPGTFSNIGVYANYTWSLSDYKSVGNRESMALLSHSPHVVNGALNYKINRFGAQVSYHWSASSLSHIATTQQRAPSLGQGMRYLDQYEEGYRELSATANYQLSERFRVWVNVNHLINNTEIEYIEERSAYPISTYQRPGFDLRVGVRFDL